MLPLRVPRETMSCQHMSPASLIKKIEQSLKGTEEKGKLSEMDKCPCAEQRV